MEFLLTSTSGWVENQIPNTVIKKYTKREVRTCSTFEEFDKRFSRREGTWLSKGVNHKAFKGRIQREFPNGAEGHFIEINSIEELLEFQKKVGNELIITSAIDNESIPAIEIYNYYRE
ncbi:hypothetical protein LIZ13_06470 [Streptococcus oralis]|uniref:hypothetical protein n=1 Tax=Streptococcus oralis TaxID=1303 RepID=UPI001D06516C|nr:hypothetical protein [Streptococcus oralis]MCB7107564.1 hypothetical protein [Streptococcus oralis]MCQ5169825.1 hypothetical protein [Streptococcus oralis]